MQANEFGTNLQAGRLRGKLAVMAGTVVGAPVPARFAAGRPLLQGWVQGVMIRGN